MSELTDFTDLPSLITAVLSVVLTGLLLLSRQIVANIKKLLEQNNQTTEETATQVREALAELVKMRQQLTAYKIENRVYKRRFVAILSDPECLPAHKHLKDIIDYMKARQNDES
jgi:ribosomal protein L29